MTKLKELKKRLMEDREFREEHVRADEEYALVEVLVCARTKAVIRRVLWPYWMTIRC